MGSTFGDAFGIFGARLLPRGKRKINTDNGIPGTLGKAYLQGLRSRVDSASPVGSIIVRGDFLVGNSRHESCR
jgi:hypothetical protein